MDIEINRGNFRELRIIEPAVSPLAEDQARLRVERFGLSSNNVSYAVVGDMLSYWDFFPASDPVAGDDTVWGRVPVWGFARVTETRSADVAVGELLFGYLPMSDEVVVTVGSANPFTVSDVSAHRAHLANAYNSLRRCEQDPSYSEATADLQMLLYPLFFTSFVIDDFLEDNADFGAERVVISSASAKTALGAAFLAKARGITVVGMTSAANRAFTEAIGIYDEVVTYDQAGDLPLVPTVFVDVAGNQGTVAAVHARLTDFLVHSMIVGDTHWDETPSLDGAPLPGPRPVFLFAPSQIAKRTEDWGSVELNRKVADAWSRFIAWVPSWLSLEHRGGAEAVRSLFLDLLENRIDPAVGYTCTMTEEVTS